MSNFENQDRDPRWDNDARRDRDHQRDHDRMRPPHPPPYSDHNGDNQIDNGRETPPRDNTERRDNSSKTRTRTRHSSKKTKVPPSILRDSGKSSRSQQVDELYIIPDTANYTTYNGGHRHHDQYNIGAYDQSETYNTNDNSGLNWGEWSLQLNGQWRRGGQDSSGNLYEDFQDEDPRVPRQTPISPDKLRENGIAFQVGNRVVRGNIQQAIGTKNVRTKSPRKK